MPAAPILVVDDDPVVVDLLVAALELDGHRVITAADGDTALERLRTTSVGAVLLDRTLPGADGLEVLRTIRADPQTSLVPVLLITGLDDTRERIAGLDVGADDYVTKPFEPEEVVARVRAHLRGHQAWVDRLTATVEHRRAVLARAAARAGTADDAREAARALCAELASVPEVAGASIVEVLGARTDPLAGVGVDGLQLLGLADRTDELDAVRAGLPDGPRLTALVDHAVVVVPVSAGERTLAVLAVTGDQATRGPGADTLLALSIDFGALAGGVLGEPLQRSRLHVAARQRFRRILDDGAFRPVFQSIVALADRATVGFEALTRFDGTVDTERVFLDAALLGTGLELEEATLAAALDAARGQPEDTWLAVNVTPSLILETDRLDALLTAQDRRSVVLEISELEPVGDYDHLLSAVDTLGAVVQLSVDDAGSGFASLAHILALHARFVKLDKSWIHGIEADPAKRALVAGLQNFAEETGAAVIAEGIETEAQFETVRHLGIRYGQGWLFGRPAGF